jgi:hypothetical protein
VLSFGGRPQPLLVCVSDDAIFEAIATFSSGNSEQLLIEEFSGVTLRALTTFGLLPVLLGFY